MALETWSNFFSAEVSASATLTGLVIVAVSINLSRILQASHLPARAAEALFSLTALFALSSLGLFPGLSFRAFGEVALALGVLLLAIGVLAQIDASRKYRELSVSRQMIAAGMRGSSAIPIALGGLLLCLQAPAGAAWIGAGIILGLVCSVMNAWVLLVEIMR